MKAILNLFFPKLCINCNCEGEYLCLRCLKELTLLKKQECPRCRKKNILGKFCNQNCGRGFYFEQLIVCSDYDKNKTIKRLIWLFKYKFVQEISEILGKIMKHQLAYFSHLIKSSVHDSEKIILIPIPAHPRRLKYRGFNQAWLLANYLAKNFNNKDSAKVASAALSENFDAHVPDSTLRSKFSCRLASATFAESFNLQICDCLFRKIQNKEQVLSERKERLDNLKNVFAVKEGSLDFIKNKSIILVDDVATTCSTLNEASKVLKSCGAKYVCGLVLARGGILL